MSYHNYNFYHEKQRDYELDQAILEFFDCTNEQTWLQQINKVIEKFGGDRCKAYRHYPSKSYYNPTVVPQIEAVIRAGTTDGVGGRNTNNNQIPSEKLKDLVPIERQKELNVKVAQNDGSNWHLSKDINNNGNTLLHLTVLKGFPIVTAQLISDHEFDIDSRRSSDMSAPMHVALFEVRKLAVIEKLDYLGADLQQRNAYGRDCQAEFDRFMRSKDNIIFFDLELTKGFYERNDEKDLPRKVLELACVITDKELKELDRGQWVISGFSKEFLESLPYFHQRNFRDREKGGLFEPLVDPKTDYVILGNNLFSDMLGPSAVPVEQAAQECLELISNLCPEGVCPLSGNSIQCDREILREEMPQLYNYLSHRIIDVSSFLGVAERWMPHKIEQWRLHQKENSTYNHRAMDDTLSSISSVKWIRENLLVKPDDGLAAWEAYKAKEEERREREREERELMEEYRLEEEAKAQGLAQPDLDLDFDHTFGFNPHLEQYVQQTVNRDNIPDTSALKSKFDLGGWGDDDSAPNSPKSQKSDKSPKSAWGPPPTSAVNSSSPSHGGIKLGGGMSSGNGAAAGVQAGGATGSQTAKSEKKGANNYSDNIGGSAEGPTHGKGGYAGPAGYTGPGAGGPGGGKSNYENENFVTNESPMNRGGKFGNAGWGSKNKDSDNNQDSDSDHSGKGKGKLPGGNRGGKKGPSEKKGPGGASVGWGAPPGEAPGGWGAPEKKGGFDHWGPPGRKNDMWGPPPASNWGGKNDAGLGGNPWGGCGDKKGPWGKNSGWGKESNSGKNSPKAQMEW